MATDTKTAKPFLHEHAELGKLFDALSEAYLAFNADDPDFTIVAENKAHATIALVQPGQIIGQPLFTAFPDTSPKFLKTGVSDLAESIRRVIKTGKQDAMETFRYDIPDSGGNMQVRYWRVTHNPVIGDNGQVSQVYQATQDVTDSISKDTQLKDTEHQLEAALNIGKIGTWRWNITHNNITADKNLARMFGVSDEAARSGLPLETFVDAIFPDDRGRIQSSIEKTIREGGSFDEEYRTIGKDSSLHWVLARGRIEKDIIDGSVVFPGVIVDITERKRAELDMRFLARASVALTESLDYQKTLAKLAGLFTPDIADWCTIDVVDPEKGLQHVGLAHKDPKKIAWAKAYRAARPPTIREDSGVGRVLKTGQPEFYPVITDELLKSSAGSEEELRLARELELSSIMIVPLIVQKETIGAITLIITGSTRHYTKADLRLVEDLAARASLMMTNARLYEQTKNELTQRVRLERALRVANEELEERVKLRTAELQQANTDLNRSNQELQDFAYVASHDLQEPLRKIQAFGNLLQDECGEQLGEGQDYLDRMRNAAARMSTLIQDLLAFSRVTTKAKGFEAVDLGQIVKDVLSDLETRVEETHAEIQVAQLPTIEADAMQMRQLMQNLISNALKFHLPGKPPKVTVEAPIESDDGREGINGKFCSIKVTDNGVGFNEKYLDRIFAVFQRLHGRDEYEGTGIGLAVCRKIAERHGGTISAKSKVGSGATFIVRIPCKQTKGKTE